MEPATTRHEYILRQALFTDARTIRQIISKMQLNPMSINWRRFVLAVDRAGNIIACGQVKPHADDSLEMASIAVLPEWRGKGVARAIINHLLEQYPGRLYLTCRSRLGPMYQKFGFQALRYSEMPPYFRRISRLVALFNKLSHSGDTMLVMSRN